MSGLPAPQPAPKCRELVFVSWNVQGCAGRPDFDPHAVADVLQSVGADIAALQECGSDGGREHAEAVARSLGVTHAAFGPNLVRGSWRFGNALLSRFPLEEPDNVALPSSTGAEPRGCVVARIALGDGLHTYAASAHLGLGAVDRASQAARLADAVHREEPILLGADGNDWFPGRDTRTLRARFRDAWRERGAGRRGTFPSRFPLLRLDHVYVNGPVEVVSCEHGDGSHIRAASDHLPVVARVRVAYYGPCSPARVSSTGWWPSVS